jgi:hypothetical protein
MYAVAAVVASTLALDVRVARDMGLLNLQVCGVSLDRPLLGGRSHLLRRRKAWALKVAGRMYTVGGSLSSKCLRSAVSR